MKVVMTLLVRDEDDILEDNLEHHLRQGIDHVIVTNNLSVDGTADILDSYSRAGVVTVIDEPSDDYAQARWVTRMARMAARDFDADWVINNDADEFWWPREGTLASTLAGVDASVQVLAASRRNFPPVVSDEEDYLRRMQYREVTSVNALGHPLPAKVCHRADRDVVVHQGNHAVEGSAEVLNDGRIEILHFPVRSYGQLENKIRLGGAAYARNHDLSPDIGSTWRWLHHVLDRGGLPDYYLQLCHDSAAIEKALLLGTVQPDTRLLQALRPPGPATS